MDEYVAFMKKYLNNPNDIVSMMSDYSDMLTELGEFDKKIDANNTSQMSSTHAAYYIDVTARCTKKMLSIYE